MTTTEIGERCAHFIAMMQPDFNWGAHYDEDGESPEKLFRACINTEPIQENEGKNYLSIQGYQPKEDSLTSVGLYRLLYLVKPKSVDFSDMYKMQLFAFRSADKRFVVSVELYKYQLSLYFYAPKEAIQGSAHGVVGGWADCDNGKHIADENGKLFFQMVKEAVEHQWDVYPGNNFIV